MGVLKDEMIDEMIFTILSQNEEIKKLRRKINQILQCLETYEECVRKGES